MGIYSSEHLPGGVGVILYKEGENMALALWIQQHIDGLRSCLPHAEELGITLDNSYAAVLGYERQIAEQQAIFDNPKTAEPDRQKAKDRVLWYAKRRDIQSRQVIEIRTALQTTANVLANRAIENLPE